MAAAWAWTDAIESLEIGIGVAQTTSDRLLHDINAAAGMINQLEWTRRQVEELRKKVEERRQEALRKEAAAAGDKPKPADVEEPKKP